MIVRRAKTVVIRSVCLYYIALAEVFVLPSIIVKCSIA